jgi:hypothetical protein
MQSAPRFTVHVVPTGTGKKIVHATDCGHSGAVRGRNTGQLEFAEATSLLALVAARYPHVAAQGPDALTEMADCTYEVRQCTKLPHDDPQDLGTSPVGDADTAPLATAYRRAHGSLAARVSTAWSVDGSQGRNVEGVLVRRDEQSADQRCTVLVPSGAYSAHLTAAYEAVWWTRVEARATETLADHPDADDDVKALSWVGAAQEQRQVARGDLEMGGGEAMDSMTRAYGRCEATALRHFLRKVGVSLTEVDRLTGRN